MKFILVWLAMRKQHHWVWNTGWEGDREREVWKVLPRNYQVEDGQSAFGTL